MNKLTLHTSIPEEDWNLVNQNETLNRDAVLRKQSDCLLDKMGKLCLGEQNCEGKPKQIKSIFNHSIMKKKGNGENAMKKMSFLGKRLISSDTKKTISKRQKKKSRFDDASKRLTSITRRQSGNSE